MPLKIISNNNQNQLSPLQFWLLNSVKYGLLSEMAIELLTIPSSTVSLERIFAVSECLGNNNSNGTAFDPISLFKSIDDPQRMERDTMLRFNRMYVPRML